MLWAQIKKVAWWALVAMVCLAMWRELPQNPGDLYQWSKQHEVAIRQWYRTTVAGIEDSFTHSSSPGSGSGTSDSSGSAANDSEASSHGGNGDGSVDGGGGKTAGK